MFFIHSVIAAVLSVVSICLYYADEIGRACFFLLATGILYIIPALKDQRKSQIYQDCKFFYTIQPPQDSEPGNGDAEER